MDLVFLSAPYTHPDPAVVDRRMKRFCEIDSLLTAGGLMTVSPLFKHLLFVNGSKLPSTWDYWEEYSKTILLHCKVQAILMIDGWGESTGIAGETAYAKSLGKETILVDVDGLMPEWGGVPGAIEKIKAALRRV